MSESNTQSKGRMKKPKGWGHWLSYQKSKEYEELVPENVEITEEELAKHNKPGDLWIGLLHNKEICVFDVTVFAEYHPGGYEILTKVAGRDATQEFKLAHAYINTNMISKFKKGYLVRTQFKSPNTLSPNMTLLPPVRRPPPRDRPKWNWVEEDKLVTLKFNLPKPLLQNMDNVIVQYTPENVLKIRLFMENEYYYFQIKLNECLTPNIDSLHYDEKEVMITLEMKNTWNFLASHLGGIEEDKIRNYIEALDVEEYLPCTISNIRDVNHDCREITFDWPSWASVGIPLGHHVIVKHFIKEEDVQRPYTPISDIIIDSNSKTERRKFKLMVKRYSEGQMSPYLHSLDIDSIVNISLPIGQFKSPVWMQLPRPSNVVIDSTEEIVLLGAGSGITPIIRVLLSILKDTEHKCKLLFFNRHQRDMIYYEEFQTIQHFYGNRFNVQHILSQADAEWSGWSGRISSDLLNKILPTSLLDTSNTIFLFCGPTGFNKLTVEIMERYKIPTTRYWEFKG